jgi:hypothetical protein
MRRNPRNTAYSNALWRRALGRLIRKFGKNGKHQRNLLSLGLFALLREAASEHEDAPLGQLAYHTGGFTYLRQPLDILRSFILYHLQTERYRRHFGN